MSLERRRRAAGALALAQSHQYHCLWAMQELPVSGRKDDLVRRVHAKLEEIAAEEV